MRNVLWLGVLVVFGFALFSCEQEKPERILVFSKTKGFRHKSIAAGKLAMQELGAAHQVRVDTTEDASYFTEDSLKNYSAVVFLNTTGDVLDPAQQAAFQRYIQAGGGFVGIHSAADTEYDWPWYGEMVGGYFMSHPKVQEAKIGVVDRSHISTQHLPETWIRTDEWYNYKSLNKNVQVLAMLDESSYEGGENGDYHPTAWYHEYDGGRAYYTGGGHTDEAYQEPDFRRHIWGAVEWAIGDNTLDYDRATALLVPEENRFVKAVLHQGLEEPMELDILPDGRILFIQRKGEVYLHDPEAGFTQLITRLPVHTKFEDGLMGLAIDPDYHRNHWIYLYYSPPGEEPVQHLSRFLFLGDSLFTEQEKVVLRVPVQRETCCHSGGSIQFGPDGLLYLSTGDDTNPFESNGYSPADERPGRGPWDAQKSSANTQDLRGKILRIRPLADGSYDIPEGNLFPPDGSEGRPEIYVMGCRNPFRISIDQHTGTLYWGDVGPDAGENSDKGPRGYDEVNQANKPGFYGWPYFIANNIPYNDYNFATESIGAPFTPQEPINNSPNNTGSEILPPAQPAMIYYPYAKTKDFPYVKEGGRNAMAGPVYHFDDFTQSKNRLPRYYDGKLLIYDWMRNWMMAVTFDEDGNYSHHEPFLPSFEFHNVIDMELSPEGTLYILEYGSKWFSANDDATLSRIDYAESNRQPIARILADKLVGAAPLKVQFSSAASFDYDPDDQLEYTWYFTGEEVQATGPEPAYTFNEPGIYHATVRVADQAGATSEASLTVQVGNEPPEVKLLTENNRSFYWEHIPFRYEIVAEDLEDGSTATGGIAKEAVQIHFDFLVGEDKTMVAQGHQKSGMVVDGQKVMKDSDCANCHQLEETSIGPSYRQIAERYATNDKVIATLSHKIIQGGGGNWGDREMAAHPQIDQQEAEAIVTYILSLDEPNLVPSLPLSGVLAFDRHQPEQNGMYILTATYKDKGANQIDSQSGSLEISLRPPVLGPDQVSNFFECRPLKPRGEDFKVISHMRDGSYVRFDRLDLTQVASLTATVMNRLPSGSLKVFADSLGGPLLGATNLPPPDPESWQKVRIPLRAQNGFTNLIVAVQSPAEASGPYVRIRKFEVEPGAVTLPLTAKK